MISGMQGISEHKFTLDNQKELENELKSAINVNLSIAAFTALHDFVPFAIINHLSSNHEIQRQ